MARCFPEKKQLNVRLRHRRPHTPPDHRGTTCGPSLDEAMANPWSTSRTASWRPAMAVKVDRDEVLLDIGYKSEGVIPNRELSIRNEVDPEVVSMGRGRGPRPPEGGTRTAA